MNKRAALHHSRPPADQSGKLDGDVAGHARHALVTDILARISRGCYAENGPVEFGLNGSGAAERREGVVIVKSRHGTAAAAGAIRLTGSGFGSEETLV